MFFIVRGWQNGHLYEQTFEDLQAARAFLRQAEEHADLYAWIAGREECMESNEG